MTMHPRIRVADRIVPIVAFLLAVAGAGGASASGIDGIVSPGEYPGRAEFADGEFVVSWRIDGAGATFAIEAEAPGWVSLGFEPTTVMDQADMVFGLVPPEGSGAVAVVDAFSDGMFGPHPADADSGGRNDIASFAGSRNGDRVVFEFARPIDTGDARDKTLALDRPVPVIWATGLDLDFESYHLRAGYGSLDLSSGMGTVEKRARAPILVAHIVLMSLSFLSMAGGAFVARFLKKKKFWLVLHKPMGALGALSGIAGVVMAGILVENSGGPHLRVVHGMLGLGTIVLSAAVPALGFRIFKTKGDRKLARKIHRIAGRAAIAAMTLVILTGLTTAGIIRFG